MNKQEDPPVNDNAIAFFSDSAMLPGLHAALVSLLKCNSDTRADVFVFADRLTDQQCADLINTWEKNKDPLSKLSFRVQPFEPKALGNRLHGNSTAYGRLYLGELLAAYKQCIYLDCDVIINRSLENLFLIIKPSTLIAADCTGSRQWSLDRQLFVDAGLSLEGRCFNSGVLAINLEKWRSSKAWERCIELAEVYRGRLASADQALLNVAFHEDVIPFGEEYNTPLYPSSIRPAKMENRIYHFVGSPKPWDLFGSILHNSYSVWFDSFKKSAIGNRSVLRYVGVKRVLRTSRQLTLAFYRRFSAQKN